MIELGIGLVAFACGFATSAVFAAQASRNAAEREAELQAKVDKHLQEIELQRQANLTMHKDMCASFERERKLREAEAKRIAHLRAIASSGGKASAAARKSGGKCK